MSKVLECSPPGGFPDAVTGKGGNLQPGADRMLILDCGHFAIAENEYYVGAGFPCPWRDCPGNPHRKDAK